MTGMDIIEAMVGIDPELVLDAKRPVKHIPKWLKWTATAACFCCMTLLVTLSLGHLLRNSDTAETNNALTSTEEAAPEEETTDSFGESVYDESIHDEENDINEDDTAQDLEIETVYPTGSDYILLRNNKYDVTFIIPEHYNATQFSVNLPLISEKFESISFDNIALSFFDHETAQFDDGGFIWSIAVWPKEEYNWEAAEEYSEMSAMLNQIPIGTNDDYVFELIVPDVTTQFATSDFDAAQNYYDHVSGGVYILQDFVERNNLESDGTWLEIYTKNIMDHVAQIYTALLVDQNTKTLSSDKYGVNISGISLFMNDIQIDTPYIPKIYPHLKYENAIFTLISPKSASEDLDGLVWSILVYPKSERPESAYTNQEEDFILHYFQLASDEEYVYDLLYPGTGCDYVQTNESIAAYYSYAMYGFDILRNFITGNGLTPAENWEDNYITKITDDIRESAEILSAANAFSDEEIEAAKDTVMEYFASHFPGCTMLDIWFDASQTAGVFPDMEMEKGVILYCDFEVDESGGDGSLNPNSIYTDWSWQLTLQDGIWTIVNYGYG